MKYQFHYKYSIEDMDALSRVAGKTYRRKRTIVYRTLLIFLCAAYLALGTLLLSGGGVIPGMLLVLAGVFFGSVALFYHRGAAWRSKRMMIEDMGAVTVELEEDGIRGRSEKGEDFCPYTSVIGVYHYRERYMLFVDKGHAMLLPEEALTQGDGAGLRVFLAEKLGQEVKEIH